MGAECRIYREEVGASLLPDRRLLARSGKEMTVVGRHYREWICRTSYSFEYGYVEYKASSLGILIQPDLIKEYAIRNGQVQELPPESLIMQIIIIIFLQGVRTSSTTILSAGSRVCRDGEKENN